MYIRKGDKNHAAHYLRQKKRALKEVEAKDNQYQRLLEMMQQLGRTKQNKQILDAYKAGADAFKATLERQGISPEEVFDTSFIIIFLKISMLCDYRILRCIETFNVLLSIYIWI